MKSVLMAIQPKWVEKIASGEKTIEVRKTRPKLQTPFVCYIYATKTGERFVLKDDKVFEISKELTGKVIGEFICKGIMDGSSCLLLKQSCLTPDELWNYAKGKRVYGWRIADLKIYDKPKELSEFYSARDNQPCEFKERGYSMNFCKATDCKYFCKDLVCDKKRLKKAPQSWCYVEAEGKDL